MTLREPEWLNHARQGLIRLETYIAGTCLLMLLALVSSQVIARNFFSASIPHIDILSRYLVLYVTFLGAALAVESQSHIRIDALAAMLTEQRRPLLRMPLYLLAGCMCTLFTWAAIRFWYDDWQYVAPQDRWTSVLALIIPIGFSLLALQFILVGLFGSATAQKKS